jgi:hypothetical protein
MPLMIEPLESRVFLSVTPQQLQADAQAVVTATAAANSTFAGVRAAETALIKAVAAHLKSNSSGLGKLITQPLITALSKAGATGYAQIKTSQNSLLAATKLSAKMGAAKGKALLKNPGDTAAQTTVGVAITSLTLVVPDKLAAVQDVLQSAGDVINAAFTAIIAQYPTITDALQSVSLAALAKSEEFTSALRAIPAAAAQLAADLSSITPAPGPAIAAHHH